MKCAVIIIINKYNIIYIPTGNNVKYYKMNMYTNNKNTEYECMGLN